MEMASTDGKRKGEAMQQGGSSAKRLECSIEPEAFCCNDCEQPLRPPIFMCTNGHFSSSSCCLVEVGDKCLHGSVCTGTGTFARSLGMERVVQSILLSCRHAEHGCTEKTRYYDKDAHETACPRAPCSCPEPGCGFAGPREELLAHLTGAAGHSWPSTAFRYWVPFELRVAGPGAQVLRCADDGQLFLVSAQRAAAPLGRLAVSVVGVAPYVGKATRFGCSVAFSASPRHRATATLYDLMSLSEWPPTDYICVVPDAPGDGAAEGVVVLTANIVCAEAGSDEDEDDTDDMSYYGDSDGDEDDDVIEIYSP